MKLFFAIVCSWIISVTTASRVGRAVKTTSGVVIGHAARNRSQVSEYLGIPYAQAPVANLRFEPPLAYSSATVFNASEYVSHPPGRLSRQLTDKNNCSLCKLPSSLFLRTGEHVLIRLKWLSQQSLKSRCIPQQNSKFRSHLFFVHGWRT